MAEESCRLCNGDELGFFFIAHLPECGNGKGGETGVAVCSSVKAAQLVVLIMAKHYFFGIAFFQKLCHNGKAEEVIKAPTIVKALIELMAGAVDISPAVKVNTPRTPAADRMRRKTFGSVYCGSTRTQKRS